MKKRVLSLLVTLIMIMGMASLAAVTAFAETVTADYVDADGSTRTAENVTEITKGGEYSPGWYILLRKTQNLDTITFTGSGEVHLILENGADVTVDGGILLSEASTSLTIYAQPTDEDDVEGKLTALGGANNASIGACENGLCGNIIINGGIVIASGFGFSGGIGAGFKSTCGDITINGGSVTASGSVGIGAGLNSICDEININGGSVTASGSAGIGAGVNSICNEVKINGGSITATGGAGGAAIGAAQNGKCFYIAIKGTPTIKAGNDAERAQIVSEYKGERYVSVNYDSDENGIGGMGSKTTEINYDEGKDIITESNVPTGIIADNTDLSVMIGFIAVAVAGLGVVLVRRRKEQ